MSGTHETAPCGDDSASLRERPKSWWRRPMHAWECCAGCSNLDACRRRRHVADEDYINLRLVGRPLFCALEVEETYPFAL